MKAALTWIVAGITSLLPFEVSFACSCAQMKSLQENYDRADSIVIGKVSGCVSGEPNERGYCPKREVVFDVVEFLKGSNETLPPERRRFGGMSSCDLSGKIGANYLLFVDESGHPAYCGGSGSLENERGEALRPTIEILRQYRDGISDLSGPWTYADDGRACAITHVFGEAVLKFEYAYARPQPQPMLSVNMRQGRLIDTAVLLVDGVQVPLSRQTLELHPPVQPPQTIMFIRDVAHGNAVMALLETMSKPVEVVVAGDQTLSSRPEPTTSSTWPLRAVTRTTRLAPAAMQFRACVETHAGSAP